MKWNKCPENILPRVGRYLVARKNAQPCGATWMPTWWDVCVFTDFDNFPDETWVTHWMEIPELSGE